jgi:cyanophycinase
MTVGVDAPSSGPRFGPPRGALVLVGGGGLRDTPILARFIALAGGPGAPIVVVPTARDPEDDGRPAGDLQPLMEAGALRLDVLHTRERAVADSEAFVAPLREARGVWFGGGRQWRLADAYLHTRTHEALRSVLARGGVIGGTSAGATIQGAFLARGDTSGPDVMIGDHTEGLGFLGGVAVDQHWLARNRHFDLLEVVEARPELLGIGIDEDTAIVVEADAFEVIGRSYVGIYDPTHILAPAGRFYVLRTGDRFDLAERRATRPVRQHVPFPQVIAVPQR